MSDQSQRPGDADAEADALQDLPDVSPADAADAAAAEGEEPPPAARVRKRPKPGERRVQILQTLATMLRRCTATSPARRRCSRG